MLPFLRNLEKEGYKLPVETYRAFCSEGIYRVYTSKGSYIAYGKNGFLLAYRRNIEGEADIITLQIIYKLVDVNVVFRKALINGLIEKHKCSQKQLPLRIEKNIGFTRDVPHVELILTDGKHSAVLKRYDSMIDADMAISQLRVGNKIKWEKLLPVIENLIPRSGWKHGYKDYESRG